ncbi:Cobalt uptake protein COT1 [Fusarium oxysporum f. sp. albedinis]|nr:Cobalt uptake protein COT1 [Fusarium oxysporum f. sp. albedinis]
MKKEQSRNLLRRTCLVKVTHTSNLGGNANGKLSRHVNTSGCASTLEAGLSQESSPRMDGMACSDFPLARGKTLRERVRLARCRGYCRVKGERVRDTRVLDRVA